MFNLLYTYLLFTHIEINIDVYKLYFNKYNFKNVNISQQNDTIADNCPAYGHLIYHIQHPIRLPDP